MRSTPPQNGISDSLEQPPPARSYLPDGRPAPRPASARTSTRPPAIPTAATTGRYPALTALADRTRATLKPAGAKERRPARCASSCWSRWTPPRFDTSSPVGIVPTIPAVPPRVPVR